MDTTAATAGTAGTADSSTPNPVPNPVVWQVEVNIMADDPDAPEVWNFVALVADKDEAYAISGDFDGRARVIPMPLVTLDIWRATMAERRQTGI